MLMSGIVYNLWTSLKLAAIELFVQGNPVSPIWFWFLRRQLRKLIKAGSWVWPTWTLARRYTGHYFVHSVVDVWNVFPGWRRQDMMVVFKSLLYRHVYMQGIEDYGWCAGRSNWFALVCLAGTWRIEAPVPVWYFSKSSNMHDRLVQKVMAPRSKVCWHNGRI